ncbi:hypothetical protein [Kordia jejudonensis]|uniref:hypothetical protein n=1 Tax=Kordia jejudonensis TaxID=1348245 RepID=UPI0006292A53|nr:hypothetical protein [Kordia jejudonensis]
MLKKIRNLQGTKHLSKKEQQKLKGGNVDGYTCPTGPYLVFGNGCNGNDHLHPQGHCLCCEAPWQGPIREL